MPDFSLPVYQGGELKFSSLRGKTVLMIFPRGLAGKDHWCHVCNYQYMELAEAEQSRQLRKQYNLEILFVLPYSRSVVKQWLAAFPAQLADIAAWKNPPQEQRADEKVRLRMERIRQEMPKEYTVPKEGTPIPFPILVDADRVLTKGLGIFAEEWSGSRIDQNIPTVIIVDPQGMVQFKYMSQNTWDRPPLPYLEKMLEK